MLGAPFSGKVPDGFGLQATDLVNGQGHFAAASREDQNMFVHAVHLIGIDKKKLAGTAHKGEPAYVRTRFSVHHSL
jgi:hypothetical protein